MAMNEFDRLSLEVEESDVVVRTEEEEGSDDNANLCLVGRFLTDRPIRVHIMRDRMAGVWRPLGGVTITGIEPGLFTFQFYHQVDVQRVLRGGPWSFDKHLMILSAMNNDIRPNQLPLFMVPFWVQAHNPRVSCRRP